MRIKNRWLALALVATLTFTNTCQGAGLNSVSENEILQSDTDIENAMDTYESNQDASEITPEVLSQEESENTSEIIPDGMPLEDSENTEGDIQEESGMLELLSNGAFVTLPEGEIYEYTQSYPAEDGISMEKGEAFTFEEYVIEQINLGKTQIDVGAYRIPVEDFRDVMSGVLNSHPEIFFLTGGYSWSHNYTYVLSVTLGTIAVSDEDKAAFYEEVDKPLELIDESMSPIEKALTIHDFIVADIEYSSERYETNTLQSEDYNMLGVVVRKKAVCQGYAEAYYYYMKKLGIPCELVSSSNHAWNQIQLDGKWYQVDCTWDDPTWDMPGRVRHEFFVKSDAFFDSDPTTGLGGHNWNSKKYEGNDTRYDSTTSLLFLCDTQTHYDVTDQNWYFLSGSNYIKCTKAHLFDESLTSATVVKNMSARWRVWDDTMYYWTTNYTKIIPRDGYVIYSDTQNIYYMSYDGSVCKNLYTLSSTEINTGYIYGLRVKNNKVQYALAQSPRVSSLADYTFGSVAFPNLSSGATFTKTDLTYSFPANAVYDGNPHPATVRISGGVTGAGTLKVTYEDAKGNKVASPINAGSYKVYAETTGGINYAPMAKTILGSVIIAKAMPTLVSPASRTGFAVGQTLSEIELDSGWSFVDPLITTIDEVGDNYFEIIYHCQDVNNYAWSEIAGYDDTDKCVHRSIKLVTDHVIMKPEYLQYSAPSNLTYSGSAHYASVRAKTGYTGVGAITVIYENSAGDVVASPITPDTYKVYVTVAAGSYYSVLGKTLMGSFTIAKADPYAVDFSVTLPRNVVYDGETHLATASVKSTVDGMGAATFYYLDSDDYRVLRPTNAGGYRLYVDVEEGTNYNSATGIALGAFTIAKSELVSGNFIVTLPEDSVYDGTEKLADVTPAEGISGIGDIIVSYKNAAGLAVMAPIDAGTYKAYLQVDSGQNYIGFTKTYIGAFTIAKAIPELTRPTSVSGYAVGQTLADVNLPVGWSFVEPLTTTIEEEGDNVFAIRYYPTDVDNYDWSEIPGYDEEEGYVSASYTVNANKLLMRLTYLEYSIPANLIYDGYTHYASVQAKSGYTGIGTIFVSYAERSTGAEVTDPVLPGTYNVFVSVGAGSVYGILPKTMIGSFTITAPVSTPTPTQAPTIIPTPWQDITWDPNYDPWSDYEDEYEVELGDEFDSGKLVYEVTSVGASNTVSVVEPVTTNIKSITIPDKVTYEGITFSVTGINAKAFLGCKNLKKITVKATGLKKVGKKAFSGIYYRAVVKVPKKQLKLYQKLFKNKGLNKNAKIK